MSKKPTLGGALVEGLKEANSYHELQKRFKQLKDEVVEIALSRERIKKQYSSLESRLAKAREALEKAFEVIENADMWDCGDNSCAFAGRKRGGMRTTGGCRCQRNARDAIQEIWPTGHGDEKE